MIFYGLNNDVIKESHLKQILKLKIENLEGRKLKKIKMKVNIFSN
jgi:hypothetical protein